MEHNAKSMDAARWLNDTTMNTKNNKMFFWAHLISKLNTHHTHTADVIDNNRPNGIDTLNWLRSEWNVLCKSTAARKSNSTIEHSTKAVMIIKLNLNMILKNRKT